MVAVKPLNLARCDLVAIRQIEQCAERGRLSAAARLALIKASENARIAASNSVLVASCSCAIAAGCARRGGAMFIAYGRVILDELQRLNQQLAIL